MFNPSQQIKANRAKALGLIQSRSLDSKAEKKECKPDKEEKKESKDPDDNEEGMISDAEAYQASIGSDFNDHKPAMQLLGRYEKFPEYIQVKVERNPRLFDYEPTFKSFSRFTYQNIFSAKERHGLIDSAFPFTLHCFLIPELNVLSLSLVSDSFGPDQLLGNLFTEMDLGQ